MVTLSTVMLIVLQHNAAHLGIATGLCLSEAAMKVRVGYGVTGNASIKPYQTSGTMTASGAGKFFGVGNITQVTIGAKASVLPNLDLGWEKTASTNIGVDFGFLNNRISGSVEYYVAKTSDLLLAKSLPLMTGYTSITTNIGTR